MGEAKESNDDMVIASVHSIVFKESENLDGKCLQNEGYDFNRGVDYQQLLSSVIRSGFQASNLGDAIQVVNNQMPDSRLVDEPIAEDCIDEERDLD